MKKIKCCIFAVLLIGEHSIFAQNIQPTLLDASALVLNPAYTGMMNGDVRASALMRDAWMGNRTYKQFLASADAPLITTKQGNYFAVGALMSVKTIQNSLYESNSGVLSAAYHYRFKADSNRLKEKGSELAIGVQAGYAHTSIDMAPENFQALYVRFPLPRADTVANVEAPIINAGIGYSAVANKYFSYTLGINVQNIYQPGNALKKKEYSDYGFDTRLVASAGCDILVIDRLSIKPAMVVFYNSGRVWALCGGDAIFRFGGEKGVSFVAGSLFHSSRVVMLSPGVKKGGFWFRASIELQLNRSNDDDTGMELAIGFTNPGKGKKNRHISYNRF